MKTSEFIAALAADPIPEPIRIARRFVAALALGCAGALILYALVVGPRPDFAAALGTVRFDLKFVDALALALPSLLLLVRLARPDAKPGTLALWLIAPLLLLAAAVVVELIAVPRDEWLPRLVGQNMRYCTTMIPMMAAPILAALIWRDAGGRAPASGMDGSAGGRLGRRPRLVPLRVALPRRFAAVRRDLVSARDPRLRRGRRVGRAAVPGVVRRGSRRFVALRAGGQSAYDAAFRDVPTPDSRLPTALRTRRRRKLGANPVRSTRLTMR